MAFKPSKYFSSFPDVYSGLSETIKIVEKQMRGDTQVEEVDVNEIDEEEDSEETEFWS